MNESHTIRMFDPSYQTDMIWTRLKAEIEDVVRSGVYILGPNTRDFESALSTWIGSRHAVGVGSGTDALFLALKSLGIGDGDEVITTPFTFIATVQAILRTGATPIFADILPDTLNLDPASAAQALSPRTKAVLVVHLYGQPCDMDAFMKLADTSGTAVVEDAAQALGARWKGRRAGTFGAVAALSFFPSKTLGAAGDGGGVITDRDDLEETVKTLRVHGATQKYFHTMLGTNSRLDEVQAAILKIKLELLDGWNAERRGIARRYDDNLVGGLVSPIAVVNDAECVYSQYTVRVADGRNHLQRHLALRDISTAIHYPMALHLQPALSNLGYEEGDFPWAEAASREVLSLPCYPGLDVEDQERVIKAIHSWEQS